MQAPDHAGDRKQQLPEEEECRLPLEISDAKTGGVLWEHPHWRMVQNRKLNHQEADMSGGLREKLKVPTRPFPLEKQTLLHTADSLRSFSHLSQTSKVTECVEVHTKV